MVSSGTPGGAAGGRSKGSGFGSGADFGGFPGGFTRGSAGGFTGSFPDTFGSGSVRNPVLGAPKSPDFMAILDQPDVVPSLSPFIPMAQLGTLLMETDTSPGTTGPAPGNLPDMTNTSLIPASAPDTGGPAPADTVRNTNVPAYNVPAYSVPADNAGDVSVPEPASLSLLGLGAIAAAWRRRRSAR